jgi:hypothetical protein
MIQLNELLSSYNLCLNSYEEKIGATTRGESLCEEKISILKEQMKMHCKRVRHDSNTEKKPDSVSPENKRVKQESGLEDPPIGVKLEENLDCPGDLGTMEIKDDPDPITIKEDQEPREVDPKNPLAKPLKKKEPFIMNSRLVKENSTQSYKPLLTEECLKKIREGWSMKNVGDITIGDLYLMFGSEGKLLLEYHWLDDRMSPGCQSEPPATQNPTTVDEIPQPEPDTKKFLGNRLKQLLAISNLLDRNKPIVNCTCGHICEKKIKMTDLQMDSGIFKQPAIPCRNTVADMNYRSNLNVSF